MKVELENLQLNISPLTNEVFVGIIKPNGFEWKEKKNVTNDFIGCAVRRFENRTEIITSGSEKWEITCKKITN